MFLFASDFYQIYCLLTGHLLFQVPCKDGLYPIYSTFCTPKPLLPLLTLSFCTIVLVIRSPMSFLASSLLRSKLSINVFFCKDYAMSKSRKLLFPPNNASSTSPFQIIHVVMFGLLLFLLLVVLNTMFSLSMKSNQTLGYIQCVVRMKSLRISKLFLLLFLTCLIFPLNSYRVITELNMLTIHFLSFVTL